MGDYDYYEEPQPVPTFSDGSTSGGRGDNFRAAASRVSASKSAVSTASRASAMMTASIQQLPKNSIITSTGIRTIKPSAPSVNIMAVKAAQKRSEVILNTVKPPEPVVIKQPIEIVARIPQSTVILEPVTTLSVTKTLAKSQAYRSDTYKDTVILARSKKEELLASLEVSPPDQTRQYGPIKYIRHNTISSDNSINKPALEQLAYNLSSVLKNTDKTLILEEFNKYQINMRILIEQPLHKTAFQQALANKRVYLTSDA